MYVWRFRGDRTSTACIGYRHKDSAPFVMIWAIIGYTTRKSLVRISGNFNLNADRYISDIFRPVAVSYFRGLPNFIVQQDNTKLHVARCVLVPWYTGYSIAALAWTISRSVTHWKHLVMDYWESSLPPHSGYYGLWSVAWSSLEWVVRFCSLCPFRFYA